MIKGVEKRKIEQVAHCLNNSTVRTAPGSSFPFLARSLREQSPKESARTEEQK